MLIFLYVHTAEGRGLNPSRLKNRFLQFFQGQIFVFPASTLFSWARILTLKLLIIFFLLRMFLLSRRSKWWFNRVKYVKAVRKVRRNIERQPHKMLELELIGAYLGASALTRHLKMIAYAPIKLESRLII